jgi:hypothetical protein
MHWDDEVQGSKGSEKTEVLGVFVSRSYQCRFKRAGQFWTKIGDEALVGLETFWRTDRWHLIFPHASFNL